jgi:hypothetical protein
MPINIALTLSVREDLLMSSTPAWALGFSLVLYRIPMHDAMLNDVEVRKSGH